MNMKNKGLLLFMSLVAFFLILNSPLYGAQESRKGHSDKTKAMVEKDLTIDNIRVKVELITMEDYMESMGYEMKHEMPNGRHTHGKIVHDISHGNLTHHLMVEVIDIKTDKAIKDAQVDLRLTYPKGKERSLMLHTMTIKGIIHYAGELNLSEKGNYLLELSFTREGMEKKTSFEVVID